MVVSVLTGNDLSGRFRGINLERVIKLFEASSGKNIGDKLSAFPENLGQIARKSEKI